jgi:hypothetical protein
MKNSNALHFVEKSEDISAIAVSGISLHCHTLHSRELLDFVPYYAERIPVFSTFWRRAMESRTRLVGEAPNIRAGYWEPPLSGIDVTESEEKSIRSLGLSPIVSITDHDSISANLELRETPGSVHVPISMEWTVPYQKAFFHVGVHNLPHGCCDLIYRELLEYTFAEGTPDVGRLRTLLNSLNEIPEVLIVLNHPIWDIEMIGQRDHEAALRGFLADFSSEIHALEVNGFRSLAENLEVVQLAEDIGLPTISGGDRHCCQANTVLNISNASTFDEFVYEIRVERRSRIIVTPEYHVPLPSRQLASIGQILGDYAHFPAGRRRWSDRVHYDANDGLGIRSLTDHWGGRRPMWTFAVIGLIRMLGRPAFRRFIAEYIGDTDIGREESMAVSNQAALTAPNIVRSTLEQTAGSIRQGIANDIA